MVFFHRLRLRWRERRFDRKLRELEVAPTHRHVPRSSLKSLVLHRVMIQPLGKPRINAKGTPPLREEVRPHEPDLTASHVTTKQQPPHRLLTDIEVAFVRHYQRQQQRTSGDDEKHLRALQRILPSTKPHIATWIEKQQCAQYIRVNTERDLARWKRTQRRMHQELVRIQDLVASAARRHLVDRKRPADATVTNQSLYRIATLRSSVYLPHPDICVAMVVVTMLAGVYGLVALGVLLKLTRKI